MVQRVRVLIVDDSALVRDVLSQGLAGDPQIEVVGTASDPFQARDKILQLKPDVLTLDVEMPRMGGVEFLKKLMPQHPIPTIMVSALTEKGKQITFEALEAGAVDFVAKPKADIARGLSIMMKELRTKVKVAATANVTHFKKHFSRPLNVPAGGGSSGPGWERLNKQSEKSSVSEELKRSTVPAEKIIAIGASTGGTEAVKEVVSGFSSSLQAAVVIVQHMPAGFTKRFSERLSGLCALEVKEAQDGDLLTAGLVLIAPGGSHLRVVATAGQYRVQIQAGEPVSGHCPSVDVMMQSVAEQAGSKAIGIMLTGMGRDGAAGMRRMRDAGGRCLAQDEETSVVFGMPKEAFALGGAERLVPLESIAAEVEALI